MIVCVLSLRGAAQSVDTICLPRIEVVGLVNDLARCDSATVLLNNRIGNLEEIRGELLMQNDSYKRMNVNMIEENTALKEQVKSGKVEMLKSKLKTRIVVAIAVAVEITTIYLLVQ